LEPLEALYGTHRLIDSVFIHGSLRAYDLIAIAVPRSETFVPWAQKIVGNADAGLVELCKDERISSAMVDELRTHVAKAKSPTLAAIGAVHLEPHGFANINVEFLTASLKLRRFKIVQHYDSVFDGLYQKLGQTTDPKVKISGSA
ncbi:hypothetical protein LPJ53_006095, partial [Coemansia erecta]